MSMVEDSLGNVASAADGTPWRIEWLRSEIDALPTNDATSVRLKGILQEIDVVIEIVQTKFFEIFLATQYFMPKDEDFAALVALRDEAFGADADAQTPDQARERSDRLHAHLLRLQSVASSRYQARRAGQSPPPLPTMVAEMRQ